MPIPIISRGYIHVVEMSCVWTCILLILTLVTHFVAN